MLKQLITFLYRYSLYLISIDGEQEISFIFLASALESICIGCFKCIVNGSTTNSGTGILSPSLIGSTCIVGVIKAPDNWNLT